MSQARKGDLVVVETVSTIRFTNPYRSESRPEFMIFRVASATRDGIVKSVQHFHHDLVQKLEHMAGKPRVHTIPNHQAEAKRLMQARTKHEWQAWDSVETLRSALLAQSSHD